MQKFLNRKKEHLLLVVILLLGALFRFYGLNWDQGQHLHPDERFLTMVTQAIQWPKTLGEYFDTNTSPLNPHNQNFSFFVYGTFPLFLTKFLGGIFQMTDYFTITLFGRGLSAFLDTLSILLIFLIGKKVFPFSKIGLLAAFLYAISVLPIQLSHFYATDTFLNFFLLATTFFLTRLAYERNYIWSLLSGICFGLSLASKISALEFLSFIAVLFLLILILWREKLIIHLFVFTLAAFVVFRIGQPYAFAGNTFFNISLNPQFIQNLQELKNLSIPYGYFPPSVQWHNTSPIIYPLQNMVLWGLGLPIGTISILSVFTIAYDLFTKLKIGFSKRNLDPETILLISFITSVIIIFVYQAIQFVKPVRYFIIIYPFLSLVNAYFLVKIFLWLSRKVSRPVTSFAFMILFFSFIVWPVAFFSIYTKSHSRVAASEWIYQNIPIGSKIGTEHWDDGLPLSFDSKRNNTLYHFEELPMFDEDSDEKWSKLNMKLRGIDYIVLSSNRAYGSVVRLPQRYPQTILFYKDLFEGRLNFVKVAEFTSRPTIFGFEIIDDNADETFTVYDHPRVIIYKRSQ